MTNSRFYSSIAAVTNLQVTVAPTDVSIQVASSIGFPSSFPFTLSLDYGSNNEELVDVTGGGPTVFNVTRAVDNTSATTHNAGAVVRHVSSARDFTDSRTHEASNSGVHGITGAFVDTQSTQTLSNKTLSGYTLLNGTLNTGSTLTATGATIANGTYTSPTINTPVISGGTLSGTIAGTATYTGTQTFTAAALLQAGAIAEGLVVNKPTGPTVAVTVKRDADTNGRLNVTADGAMGWSDASTPTSDTILQRTGSAALGLTGSLSASGPITSSGLLTGSNLSITDLTWTTFTPVWNNLGGATFSTNIGYYAQVGKLTFVQIEAVWASGGIGDNSMNVTMPTTPFRPASPGNFVGPVLTMFFHSTGSAGGSFNWPGGDGMGYAPIYSNQSGATTGALRANDGGFFSNGATKGPGGPNPDPTSVSIHGWYRSA